MTFLRFCLIFRVSSVCYYWNENSAVYPLPAYRQGDRPQGKLHRADPAEPLAHNPVSCRFPLHRPEALPQSP